MISSGRRFPIECIFRDTRVFRSTPVSRFEHFFSIRATLPRRSEPSATGSGGSKPPVKHHAHACVVHAELPERFDKDRDARAASTHAPPVEQPGVRMPACSPQRHWVFGAFMHADMQNFSERRNVLYRSELARRSRRLPFAARARARARRSPDRSLIKRAEMSLAERYSRLPGCPTPLVDALTTCSSSLSLSRAPCARHRDRAWMVRVGRATPGA